MRPFRIYVDTSVIGGCLDPEFAKDSLRLMRAAKKGEVVLLVSAIVARELAPAPPSVSSINSEHCRRVLFSTFR